MNAIVAQAASSLLNAAWQGAVLALLVALVLRLLPAMTATLRSAVWAGVFLLAVALHFLPHMDTTSARYHANATWSIAIAALWIAASLVRALRFGVSLVRLQGLRRRSVPVGRTITVPHRRPALLCTSSEVFRPTVLGFFRPRVILPQAMYDTVTPEELNYILLHEVTHLRRADDWTNLLQKCALVLFPLDPALLWIERRLCLEREFACDDYVIAQTGAPRSYALCLTTLAERGIVARASSLALGAWHRRSELVDRVERMLSGRRKPATRRETWLTGSLLGVALAMATLVTVRQPQLLTFADAPVALAESTAVSAAPLAGAHMVLASAHLTSSHTTANKLVTGLGAMRPTLQRAGKHRASAFTSTATLQMTKRYQRVAPGQLALRRTAYESSNPSEFVPALAYAVATPDGWILITL